MGLTPTVPRGVALGVDAKTRGVEQPGRRHGGRLGVRGAVGEHRVKACGRDAPVKRAVGKLVGENLAIGVPQIFVHQQSHCIRSRLQHWALK